MSTRKIIVYQRYSTKPVILTDTSETTREEIQTKILEVLKSDKISILETNNDILFIRPSEIQSILITKPSPENPNLDDQTTPPENLKKKNGKYDEKLNLEKK